ncbi:MAG: AzlD domain-containing protein [Deltaproteobacteria bacterium]|nr:MAG: AzlD domain-containing protein [Deltaproteobacteria bacterium]
MTLFEYLLILLGMGAVTYLPRLLPLLFLTRWELPRWLVEWLELIPVAILAALLAPALLVDGKSLSVDFTRADFIVAIPTFLFAYRVRSLGGTVVVGMAIYWLYGKVV